MAFSSIIRKREMADAGSPDFGALMDRAVALAQSAGSAVFPNPRVGAVYWKDGRVLAEGFHAACGTDHAEVAAAKSAKESLEGSTLAVTLEPCSHQGRTPPCTEFLMKNRIARVVFGLPDPNPAVQGIERLREAGIEVFGPVYRPGLLGLVEPFCKNILSKRCYLILKWAMTLDGKIAAPDGDSRWVTGEDARRDGHLLRSKADGVLVGAGTVLSDRPRLDLRMGITGASPRPIVWDPRGRTAGLEEWWDELLSRRPLVFTTPGFAAAGAWPSGVKVLPLEPFGELDALLFSEGLHCVLVEGGAAMHGHLLDAELADAVVAYIAPSILGGETSVPAVGGRGRNLMSRALGLREIELRRLGRDVAIGGLLKTHHPSGAGLLSKEDREKDGSAR